MAVKRNGLGKGLDSLIPNKSDKLTKPETKKNNSEVKVSPAKKVKEDPKASEILNSTVVSQCFDQLFFGWFLFEFYKYGCGMSI